jgi:hypothetical protein
LIIVLAKTAEYLYSMEKEANPSKAKESFPEYMRYTYADYLTWPMVEMMELMEGKIFRQVSAAGRLY